MTVGFSLVRYVQKLLSSNGMLLVTAHAIALPAALAVPTALCASTASCTSLAAGALAALGILAAQAGGRVMEAAADSTRRSLATAAATAAAAAAAAARGHGANEAQATHLRAVAAAAAAAAAGGDMALIQRAAEHAVAAQAAAVISSESTTSAAAAAIDQLRRRLFTPAESTRDGPLAVTNGQRVRNEKRNVRSIFWPRWMNLDRSDNPPPNGGGGGGGGGGSGRNPATWPPPCPNLGPSNPDSGLVGASGTPPIDTLMQLRAQALTFPEGSVERRWTLIYVDALLKDACALKQWHLTDDPLLRFGRNVTAYFPPSAPPPAPASALSGSSHMVISRSGESAWSASVRPALAGAGSASGLLMLAAAALKCCRHTRSISM